MYAYNYYLWSAHHTVFAAINALSSVWKIQYRLCFDPPTQKIIMLIIIMPAYVFDTALIINMIYIIALIWLSLDTIFIQACHFTFCLLLKVDKGLYTYVRNSCLFQRINYLNIITYYKITYKLRLLHTTLLQCWLY